MTRRRRKANEAPVVAGVTLVDVDEQLIRRAEPGAGWRRFALRFKWKAPRMTPTIVEQAHRDVFLVSTSKDETEIRVEEQVQLVAVWAIS